MIMTIVTIMTVMIMYYDSCDYDCCFYLIDLLLIYERCALHAVMLRKAERIVPVEKSPTVSKPGTMNYVGPSLTLSQFHSLEIRLVHVGLMPFSQPDWPATQSTERSMSSSSSSRDDSRTGSTSHRLQQQLGCGADAILQSRIQ